MVGTKTKDLEKDFQNAINNNSYIQKGILNSIFNSENLNYKFEDEVEYINGITSDFTIMDNNNHLIKSVLECKRADIGVTDFVRGIGQLYQYEYFFEKKISPKKYSSYKYKEKDQSNFINALVIPSDFIKNTKLNIAKFKYPETSIMLEVNVKNYNVRRLDKKYLNDLASKYDDNTIAISQYYFRDNRIFEYYILLKFIQYWNVSHPNEKLQRKYVEKNYLKKIHTINNGNWRNAFITLKGLGFIDNDNKLTISGNKMLNKSLTEFIFTMYKDYLKEYIDLLLYYFKKDNGNLKKSNKKIALGIKELYNNKDILYLTQSDSRYISSFLNIMRDDLCFITFEPRSSNRNIINDPQIYKEEYIKSYISENNIGKRYLNNFYVLVENDFNEK